MRSMFIFKDPNKQEENSLNVNMLKTKQKNNKKDEAYKKKQN